MCVEMSHVCRGHNSIVSHVPQSRSTGQNVFLHSMGRRTHASLPNDVFLIRILVELMAVRLRVLGGLETPTAI